MNSCPYMRLLVTGGTGFMGRHIVPALKAAFAADVVSVGSGNYDLRDPVQADRMFRDIRPDAVVHLASFVGGIIANKKYPADFVYNNLMINTNTFHAAFSYKVRRFLTLIGGCSYPANARSPITEDQMWDGYPQPESAPYSVAKKMMLVISEAYRRQHGFDSTVLIPGNVYGEYDNFNEEYAHVIPALLRRFVEAKEAGAPCVVCYGSGRPTRDFVYAGDVARLIPWFLTNYHSSEPVNISTGTRVSIRELAETICKVTGYTGEIRWDTSKPDGQMDKIFSVERLHKLGMNCSTLLEEGLRRTLEWFLRARKEGTVRL
jgi:GDP-L-fucose synthase